MPAVTAEQVRTALAPGNLDPLLTRLRLRPEDHAALIQHVATVDERDLADVAGAATAVGAELGHWAPAQDPVFAAWPDAAGRPRGLIPLLGLLVAIPGVREYHAGRGISAATTFSALADLGQQLWVYRRTFGEFGLDNQEWLTTAWSGAFFWLGRLQANLIPGGDIPDGHIPDGEGHVLSIHIPRTGPLAPQQVDESFARAREFFRTHFADAPARALHCDSWLLDPRLAEVLDPESNMARFQRRWRLVGTPRQADAATLYFTFGYRPRPGEQEDRTGLPRETTLQRAVLEHLDAGGHWYSYTGLIDLPGAAR